MSELDDVRAKVNDSESEMNYLPERKEIPRPRTCGAAHNSNSSSTNLAKEKNLSDEEKLQRRADILYPTMENKQNKKVSGEMTGGASNILHITNKLIPEALKISQDYWTNQNKNDNKLITLFIWNKSGTMYQQLAVSDSSELKKQRAEFLRWLYEIQDIEKNY